MHFSAKAKMSENNKSTTLIFICAHHSHCLKISVAFEFWILAFSTNFCRINSDFIEPNFPILKKILIPDYDAILKGPTQLENPPKGFLACPWAGLRPKTRVTQILVLKLKNALPKPYDE